MVSKLPRWVWSGAAALAFCAGMVNVIAILGFVHKGITHVTGNCSLFSIFVVDGDWNGIRQTAWVVASFFAGAALSGLIIGDAHLRMGRRYGAAMGLECTLLLASTVGFVRGGIYGEYFASMAAGLQNGMASTYSESIVRTTHLTGILTDLGSLAGNALRGIKVNMRRVNLLAVIFLSFLGGGLLGTVSYRRFGAYSMLVPAFLVGASSLVYEVFRIFLTPPSK